MLRNVSILALLTLGVAFHCAAQDEEPVVTVDSSIVVLNASIVDGNGKHVPGLTQNQFRIFEDGREQAIDFFAAEENPFAAVILLDTSGSMGEQVSLARSAAIRFLDGLRGEDSAAIYRFDSKVVLVQEFSNSRDVSDKLFDVKSQGMTTLNDAIYQAAMELDKRQEKRRAIIVLSDGQDTSSGRSADKALKAALAADASIYTIDMSPMNVGANQRMQNIGALRNFAEKTGGTFISTPGGVAMRQALAAIVAELGTQYTLGYEPSNSAKDGKWHAIELRVARPNLKIRTRKGYTAEKAK